MIIKSRRKLRHFTRNNNISQFKKQNLKMRKLKIFIIIRSQPIKINMNQHSNIKKNLIKIKKFHSLIINTNKNPVMKLIKLLIKDMNKKHNTIKNQNQNIFKKNQSQNILKKI